MFHSPTVNYVLGSGENLHIDVKVENSGEDAFEAAYYLMIPPGVTYAKMERLDKDADTLIYCSITNRFPDGNTTLKCDLGNPMASGQKVSEFSKVVSYFWILFKFIFMFLFDFHIEHYNKYCLAFGSDI